MSDFHSDYVDYEYAKSTEGGLHSGNTTRSSDLLRTLAIALGLLVLGAFVLSLIG